MFRNLFANVRAKSPLVHNITNYVTVNDCANIVLACGASPIMADDAAEVEDITSLCAGLNLNIGTLNSRTIPSMLLAGHTANRLGRPVVLDPVGAGASHLRTETALRLLREVKFTVIRGNISEIRTLAAGSGTTRRGRRRRRQGDGRDAGQDRGIRQSVCGPHRGGRRRHRCHRHRGRRRAGFLHPQRPPHDERCHRHRLSALGPDGGILCGQPGQASGSRCCGCLRHGPCGRAAHSRLSRLDGNATYRNYIIDAIYNMTPEQLEEGARYEMR